MLPRNHPDRIQITFDDRRLVANAGLLLPATLARHLGLPELVRQRLDLGDAPGRANTSDKMIASLAKNPAFFTGSLSSLPPLCNMAYHPLRYLFRSWKTPGPGDDSLRTSFLQANPHSLAIVSR